MIQRVRILEKPRAVDQSSMSPPPFSHTFSGAFGYVREHFIKQAAVSVELRNGILLHSVAVPSRGWVSDVDENTSTGGVDLPPVGSLVFVFFPYGNENITGAFVLGSFFDHRNKKHAKFLTKGEEAKAVHVEVGGLKTAYDRQEKVFAVTDVDDEKLLIQLDKKNKKLTVTDWNDNKVTLDSNGVKLESSGTVEIRGNSKQFVTWAELNTALSTFMTALNTHTHPTAASGPPSPPTVSMSLDISAAKTTNIKTGG